MTRAFLTLVGQLHRDIRGASAVDSAFALPVLALLMLGTVQFAQILHADGALRHAVGDGIRLAKVDPSATETEVLDEVRAGLTGLNAKNITALTFQRGTKNGAQFGEVTIKYKLEPAVPVIPASLL